MRTLEKAARALAVSWYCHPGESEESKAQAAEQWRGFECMALTVFMAAREPSAAMVRAASESDALDGEGGRFGPLCDLLDFSGENKTRLVVAEALRKSIDAILAEKETAR